MKVHAAQDSMFQADVDNWIKVQTEQYDAYARMTKSELQDHFQRLSEGRTQDELDDLDTI